MLDTHLKPPGQRTSIKRRNSISGRLPQYGERKGARDDDRAMPAPQDIRYAAETDPSRDMDIPKTYQERFGDGPRAIMGKAAEQFVLKLKSALMQAYARNMNGPLSAGDIGKACDTAYKMICKEYGSRFLPVELEHFEAAIPKLMAGIGNIPQKAFEKEGLSAGGELDIGEQLFILAGRAGLHVRSPIDMFLDRLGANLHRSSREQKIDQPLPPGQIGERYAKTSAVFPADYQQEIMSAAGSLIPALSRIPEHLFAQKDPDHPNPEAVPDIRELLALEAYTREYEPTDPLGGKNGFLANYHRGHSGEPDFVYRTDPGRDALKKYDPLQLPRTMDIEQCNAWLQGAYDKHAGGKGTGAVCILDVSNATQRQIDNWTVVFTHYLEQIQMDINKNELQQARYRLELLGNTYAVSYGPNGAAIAGLKQIFDRARALLQDPVIKEELQAAKEEEAQGGLFDGLFD
ncbi:MAG: hypothetical protein NC420_10015 [Eubacterium sp.]|nr:hypothetical protein [Eubacterium sp.]MCM1217111.1 hypothetical protein [Lachnospiraceae bacterium]MCM1240367.1 hypothetical protein [Lachnospiraceae bacterium]